MILKSILRFAQMVITVAIVTTPLLYPRFSLFVRKSVVAWANLTSFQASEEELIINCVEKGETGFKELMDAINEYKFLSQEVNKLCLAVGDVSSIGR